MILRPRILVRLRILSPAPALIIATWPTPGLFHWHKKSANGLGPASRADAIGELKIKISGCINACGHHHVGHIGILGVDKKGTEFYQITLGGSADENASLGDIVGPAFTEDKVIDAIETIVDTYMTQKEGDEKFLDTYRRIGMAPFKETLYAAG